MITRAPSIISGQATFKALDGGPLITSGGGGVTDAQSVGASGADIYKGKTGTVLDIRRIRGINGLGVAIDPVGDELVIEPTGPITTQTYAALADVNVAGRVDGSATHFNSTSGLYEPGNEVKINPTTRDISQITTGAVAIVGAGSVGVQSTSGDATLAGLNATVSAPLGNLLLDGSVVDIDAANAVDIDSLGPVTIDAPTVVTTASSGPVALFGQGVTGDVTATADRFFVATGAQGANMTATTGNASVSAPAGVVDIDGSVVDIDSTGVLTIDAGGALTATAVGAATLNSTTGATTVSSSTGSATVKGASAKIENNGLRFVEIDAGNACNSNADGFNLNSIGGTNNFAVNSQGGVSTLSATNTTIQANSGGLTLKAFGFNAPNRMFLNPEGPLDASTFQTMNFQAGQNITFGGGSLSLAGGTSAYLQASNASSQVQMRCSTNQGEFVVTNSASGVPAATRSLVVSPIGNGLTYDIYTDASYTAPTATSLINKTQLEARIPDGVQGASTPQDPFGQALVWNGTQWKPGSAIQGATDEIATLIANGTGDVILTASGTGNMSMNTTDSATTIDMQSGGLTVPVGGATEPTVKANNNIYSAISGVAGTSAAVLTKDFLDKLYINRSIVEFDSHRNVTTTTGLAPDPTFTPFIDPSVAYLKSEDSVGEWAVQTLAVDGNASTFVWTRAGATNTLFQFSFSVTIVGASPSVNNDLVTFGLYLDTGGGFAQIPTSLFDITITGNTEANIASATGVARLSSGFKLQPRMANAASNNMLIRDFKLSLQEVFTGVA
jgi:hypothetical protein